MDDDFKKFLDRLKSGEIGGNPFTDEETPILEPTKNEEDIEQMLQNMNNHDSVLRDIMESVYRESDKKVSENRAHLLRQLKMDRSIFLMKMIHDHGATPKYDDSYKETIEISLKISRLIEYLMKEELREGGA